MKFAIPTAEKKLCMHFGHCRQFAIVDVNEEKAITSQAYIDAPPHEPGLLPKWLAEKGVDCVIAGGMGQRAIMLFQQANINVITGAPASEPSQLVLDYLNNSLNTGSNACGHDEAHDCNH